VVATLLFNECIHYTNLLGGRMGIALKDISVSEKLNCENIWILESAKCSYFYNISMHFALCILISESTEES
jgi:hypothetical protein